MEQRTDQSQRLEAISRSVQKCSVFVFSLCLKTKGENITGEKDLLEAIASLNTTLYIHEKTSFKLFHTSLAPRRKQGKDKFLSPPYVVHEISTDSWHQNQKVPRWADTWCWGGVPTGWELRCQLTAILCQFGNMDHWRKNELEFSCRWCSINVIQNARNRIVMNGYISFLKWGKRAFLSFVVDYRARRRVQ